jgi:acylphosphatase
MTRRIVHLRVAGRVQGVFYRAWTAERAGVLGLDGWVRNRRDGSVEMLLAGSPARVAEMIAACRRGPPDAEVSALEIIEEGVAAAAEFEILPTR